MKSGLETLRVGVEKIWALASTEVQHTASLGSMFQ